ncbi:MAG: leucine-rich repeat protein [Bacteroidaceae bacterium]|nr:leucine-rich repeat protein [Bacteroidaceae bacterium]
MKRNYSIFKLVLPIFLFICNIGSTWATTEVNVEKAGTLPTLLTTCETTVKITGSINGTDIKYIRELINDGKVTELDLSEASIVSGGEKYDGNNSTENDIIGVSMFQGYTKLKAIELPENITEIKPNAFSKSGLRKINIPDGVSRIGNDAFAYIGTLDTVVLGRRVSSLGQGVFYQSSVKMAYVKPTTPPGVPAYLFGSPKICVYTNAVEDYKASDWGKWWTIVGGLEEIYPQPIDHTDVVNKLCGNYFEDAACTQLKAEYIAMSDEQLAAAFTEGGMPQFMVDIALKIKNNNWAPYEKDFRIHSYKPYSDANYWNEKMKSSGGSYMGNPTGIYAGSIESLYIFVENDIPEDATLYIAPCTDRELISNATSGKCLKKGLNIIDGIKDALYYILYTADTKSMTKTLDEWPEMKIHIQGGKVNGYYDVARASDKEYVELLNAASHKYFTIKSKHALFNFETTAYKAIWPRTIDRSIQWFDSLTVWQQSLMGYRAEVANGQRNYAPYYLTGGEAIAPIYYNNPNFAIQGNSNDGGYANSSAYRTCYNSLECIRNSFDVSLKDMDEWCAGHECGHNNQATINLEGGAEVSNNFFSNTCQYLFGRKVSGGDALLTQVTDFLDNKPFPLRGGGFRMYYQLFLYYHQAQRNTSFLPNLFKELRKDPLKIYTPGSSNGNNSTLKFVRKACEVAQEDLTDFFKVWGFFEPMTNYHIDLYGSYTITISKTNINRTLSEIAKYPRKNREILFVEDRVDHVLTNGLFSEPGQKRLQSEKIGQYGDLGQFTDYLPDSIKPSSYSYIQSDSLYKMEGTGGVGFLVLDKDSNLVYAANTLEFSIPSIVGTDFTIYSVDADGTLRETFKTGDATEYVTLETAGTLADSLSATAIKAVISGPINSTDIKYLRELIKNGNLQSLDLSNVTVKSGGKAYYGTYKSPANAIGAYSFYECNSLNTIILPNNITNIYTNAFAYSGLTGIDIPESVKTVAASAFVHCGSLETVAIGSNVTTLGNDAFAYCSNLESVTIGAKVKTLNQGVFYNSPVKDVYVHATTPPTVDAPYIFSSKPTVHVYKASLEAYKASKWADYAGKIVGDLDKYTSVEQPTVDIEESDANAPIYDLTGRKVKELQPGKIYVRKGKKFIAK